MRKARNQIHRRYLMKKFIALILFPLIGLISPITAHGQTTISVYPEEISYNENAVVTIETSSDWDVLEATIDTSEIGGFEDLKIDPILMEQTIAVNDQTTAGTKTLEVTITEVDGTIHTEDIKIEVLPREIKDDADFDWDEAVIYFLLTDRFKDGDPSNNDPNGENYDTAHPESYHGGDFQGIIDQLDYLDELGINTIWISPIIDNINHNHRHGKEESQYGYHGYWAKDFTTIDEHFGDLETFKALIDEAHERGIKIMVDVIVNHTGYGMKMSDTGEAIPNFPTREEQAVFDGMLRENPQAGHDVLGEIYGLPDFITEDPEVRAQIIQWQTDWIERARTDAGNTIDYFRVDTVKHVEDTTWNALKNELTKIKPDFKMIGESWGATYNNTGGYLNTGRMDSLLDFDFKRIASAFAHGQIEQAEEELLRRNETMDSTTMLGHFLSSHDEDGFLYYFMQGDEDLYKVAISLQLTAKGQPVIYYGEEIGLSGKAEGNMDQGEFSENRPDFDWSKVDDHHLVEHYQKVLASRAEHSKVFAKGDRKHIAGTNDSGFSIFSRSYEDETIYIGLNTSIEEGEVNFEVEHEPGTMLKDEYNDVIYEVDESGQVKILLPGNPDGGTVILATTDEVASSQSNIGVYILIGVITLGTGAFLVWRFRNRSFSGEINP